MSAADLGLPAGGKVILVITGAVSFSGEAVADASGTVCFEVPVVETNKTVTIELSVQDANGFILYSGSNTQKVDGTGNLEVKLVRQYWTLPASLTVAVSPSAIAYSDTAPDSTSVTFSITNLDGAPDGAALSYSWKDETGAEVGTGATLTRTAGQMLGASFVPLNDSETRTYSVEVSYTDASGSTVTGSGSATATIATAATLTVDAPGIQTEGDRSVLAVKKGDSANFTADVLCYGGTVDYSWSPSSPAFGSVTGTGTHNENAGISPSAGGKYTLTVTATLGDGRVLTKDIDVYVFDLALSGGTSLSAPTPSNTHYGLFLTTSDTAGTAVTASLAGTGMPTEGVYFTWTCADPALNYIIMDDSDLTHGRFTVKPKAPGTTSFSVMAYYNGSLTPFCSKTVDVAVAGLTLTGDSTIVFNSDPAAPATANQITLTATLAGIPAIALTPVGITFESDDTSIATVTAGTASGTGRPVTVTALKWGTVTITAKATIAATSTELTATKKITILELVVKQGTAVLPDSGNIIAEGATVPLTVELKGPPAGSDIEYTWEGDTFGMLSPASTSGTNTVLTTGTGVPSGYGATITVKATYNDNEYSKVMGWSIGFSGSTADFLKATFMPNTLAKACTVSITGATTMADLQAIAKALGDPTDSNYKGVYIKLDLSGATGLTSTGDGTFYATGSKAGLATYLTGIVLPTSGLTTIGHNAFRGCTNLSGSVTIPASCDCIGKCSFKGTGITALSDGASPARTWHRVLNTDGSDYTTTPWSGTLSGAGALTALNTEIFDDVLYIPLP